MVRSGRSLSTDAIFDTLSNRRRRYVLHALKRSESPRTVRDLSEQLAAWENDVERAAVVPRQRKRLYTALHQTHLPKMAELGVISYDKDRGVVALDGAVDQFDVYFDAVGSRFDRWNLVYVVLGTVFAALAAAGMVGISPVAGVDGHVLALGTALFLTGVAVVQALGERMDTARVVAEPPEAAVRPGDDGE